MQIGAIIPQDREITLNAGRKTAQLTVANTGDRPIQIGSHYHFFEVNRLLAFDREGAFGMRLDIPSGTSVRFEPGEHKQVQLVALGGSGQVFGCNDLTCGGLTENAKKAAMDKAERKGFIKK